MPWVPDCQAAARFMSASECLASRLFKILLNDFAAVISSSSLADSIKKWRQAGETGKIIFRPHTAGCRGGSTNYFRPFAVQPPLGQTKKCVQCEQLLSLGFGGNSPALMRSMARSQSAKRFLMIRSETGTSIGALSAK